MRGWRAVKRSQARKSAVRRHKSGPAETLAPRIRPKSAPAFAIGDGPPLVARDAPRAQLGAAGST